MIFRYGYAEALYPSQGTPNARICTQKHGAGWLSLWLMCWFGLLVMQAMVVSVHGLSTVHSFLLILIYVLIIIGTHNLC